MSFEISIEPRCGVYGVAHVFDKTRNLERAIESCVLNNRNELTTIKKKYNCKDHKWQA